MLDGQCLKDVKWNFYQTDGFLWKRIILLRRSKHIMWLIVDDIRELNCEAIARTPEAAYKLISLGGWDCVCFDHDLGTILEGR